MDDIINYVMETPGNTNPNVLKGMLNNSNNGLPSVSNDDNGKVLTVVNGAWAPATGGSGGGGVLVVRQNAETGALDKTWQEIHDAGFAVLQIDATDEGFEGVGFATINTIGIYSDSYVVVFTGNNLRFSASAASDYPAPVEDNPM